MLGQIKRQAIVQLPASIFLVTWFALAAFAVPLSPGIYTDYVYDYQAEHVSGNTGFRVTAKVNYAVLYGEAESEGEPAAGDGSNVRGRFLVRLRLLEPTFYSSHESDNKLEPLVVNSKYNSLYNKDYELYAHVLTLANKEAIVQETYTHQSDATTFKNIKKQILNNLLPTTNHLKRSNYNDPDCDTEDHQELFSPDSISKIKILSKTKFSPAKQASNSLVGPTIYETVDGFQNVTYRTKVFAQAASDLAVEFHLKLVNELESSDHVEFDQAYSIKSAIKLLNLDKYQLDTIRLERERPVCSGHHCGKTLGQLFEDYQESLTEDSMASVEASIAYLRLLGRIRDAQGTGVQSILNILKQVKGQDGIDISLLDILAGARTKDSITATLKHMKLPKNVNIATAERFLSALSVAAKTKAKMEHRKSSNSSTDDVPLKLSKLAREHQAPVASLEFITREFLSIFEQAPAEKWWSDKLRWSSLLTLASLVNAYNQEQHVDPSTDELNGKISRLILDELESCPKEDADCRDVCLKAIGNMAHLGDDQYSTLRQEILGSGGRESVAAIRVLRDLLQNRHKDKQLGEKFYKSLKDLLLRVVYDDTLKTTARVLAAEMVVRFLPDGLMASEEILQRLPSIGNTELATMIYSRMSSLRPDSLAKFHENWYWKSCIINGTSTSFVRTMAKTDSMNASYGVNLENSNKGKVLKESIFDVFLDTKKQTQDLLSLGIFTRGMTGFFGGSSDGGSDEDKESTTAGMTLRLLGGYQRPIVFFTSLSELMGHYWRGTASKPTTAFDGNLLLIDHANGVPLISGFVAEQQMRGVLSIVVSGKLSASLWKRNSDSLVTTKASVAVQASQSIFTSFEDMFNSQLISFGGQAQIDFSAKVVFSSLPIQTCLQVTQPEFKVRLNSRQHDQMMTSDIRRKLARKTYFIGAKSFPLDTENNKMCSIMMPDEL